MATSKKKLGPKSYKKLTDRQRRFCEEYLVDCVQDAALRRAGYSEGANQRLMDNPLVCAEIARLKEERSKRVQFTADDVLRELKRLMLSDMGDIFDPETGAMKALKDMTPDARRCIASVEVDELTESDGEGGKVHIGMRRKVRFWDKVAALDKAMRHLGLLKDQIEISGSVTLEDLVPKRKPRA